MELIKPEFLKPLIGTSLFYPCCGNDLLLPIELFASVISDFYFVEINSIPIRPKLDDIADKVTDGQEYLKYEKTDMFLHRASGQKFRIHRWCADGRDALPKMSNLGVFFYRGDCPLDGKGIPGEGSSGVLWLGEKIFSQVLALLVPNALVVTDGSNGDFEQTGTKHLSELYRNKLKEKAMKKAIPFEYLGRKFTCIGYVGEKYGPTLVWQVKVVY